MSKRAIKTLTLIFVIVIQSGCVVSAGSYPYEPEIVELAGIIELEHRFGSPNYGETPDIDEYLIIYVFRLNLPIVVGTRETLSELNETIVADVDKVQIVFLNGRPEADLLGKNIIMRGTLSKAIWGRHFYPIIFSVSLIIAGQ